MSNITDQVKHVAQPEFDTSLRYEVVSAENANCAASRTGNPPAEQPAIQPESPENPENPESPEIQVMQSETPVMQPETPPQNTALYGTARRDYIVCTTDNALYGLDGNDTLIGNNSTNKLYGGNGNDLLDGGAGDDLLDGGAGDDYLKGGAGSDTYIFGRGKGNDTLFNGDDSDDAGNAKGRVDTLELEWLNPVDIKLKQDHDDLAVVIKDTGESVRILSFFSAAERMLDAVKFADGTIWDRATLLAQEIEQSGTAGDDKLNGWQPLRHNGPNLIHGYEGNDTLLGGGSTDRLFGGAGADFLSGSEGDDFLDGGADNDVLAGGSGNDTYVFARGQGHDTIENWDPTSRRVDTLKLDGLKATDIRLENREGDLLLTVTDTGETVRIAGHFNNAAFSIDAIQFADGSTWNPAEIVTRSQALYGSMGYDLLVNITGQNNTLYGLAGNDTLVGNDSANHLYGDIDNDFLYGNAGDDLLAGGSGNDYLEGGAGNDTYIFGRGQGNDKIYNQDTTAGRVDTLKLECLNATDIRLVNLNGELVVSIKDSGESVRIPGHFIDPAFRIDTIQFADGSSWNQAEIVAQSKAMDDDMHDYLLNLHTNLPSNASSGIRHSRAVKYIDRGDSGDASNPLSLGDQPEYYALSLDTSVYDQLPEASASDRTALLDRYRAAPSIRVTNARVIADAMADFEAGGSNPLPDQQVESFNASFNASVDASGTTAPPLNAWSLNDALLKFQLADADSPTFDGDRANEYGKSGSLSGLGLTTTQALINDSYCCAQAQTLTALAGLPSALALA